jgi:hypothetical protein
MNRRTFLIAGVAATAAITFPVLKCRTHTFLTDSPLMRPTVLANFCDANTIRKIGDHYRAQVPAENRLEKLRELLLTDEQGRKPDVPDEDAISELLNKKVNKEFKEGKIVIEEGWVLSKTEARQCALFSLER